MHLYEIKAASLAKKLKEQSAVDIDSHASSGGFDTLIDAVDAELTEYDSGTQVVLMTFQGADADTFYLIHDTDAATVLSVATSVS